MNDDDVRDLLYVMRAMRRTYDLAYHSYRHSAELENARLVFDRLFRRYFNGLEPSGYPDYEPRLTSEDQPVADVIRRFTEANAEAHARIQATLK